MARGRSSARWPAASASAAPGRAAATAELGWRALIVVRARRARDLRPRRRAEPSRRIVELVEAAGWDEREAHDLYGLAFDGHDADPRARRRTPTTRRAWMTPVTGDGVHQVAVGPIHAGVIESGHFRFHVVGERILAMDPRLFYKHRGLERAAEGRASRRRRCPTSSAPAPPARSRTPSPTRTPSRTPSACDPTASCGSLARCCSSSSASTTTCTTSARSAPASGSPRARWPSPRSRIALSRSTLRRSGIASCSAPSPSAVARWSSTPPRSTRLRAQLRELRTDSAAAWRELEFAGSLQARLGGVGVLSRDDALRARRRRARGPRRRDSRGRADH